MSVGIVGYGARIPAHRIKVEEIARVWNKDPAKITESLGLREKAVGCLDEDSATFAVESARAAIKSAGILPSEIGAIFVGSESKPYAVKPTATIVAAAIGASTELMAADFEFACKAGTAAMQVCMGMAISGMIKYGLAIGTDTSQGRPGDALEYSTGAGGAAMLIGTQKLIAEIEATTSYTSDTPDFWRRQHAEFPSHAGRFTAEPAYFKHVKGASTALLEKTNTKPGDYDYAVFHQPNGKFPIRVAKMLGFSEEVLKPGLLVPEIGNTYSGATMLGLSAVLDIAKPGDRIFACSYGSGAGADAFAIRVTDEIAKPGRKPVESVREMISRKHYLTYAEYVKHRKKLKSL